MLSIIQFSEALTLESSWKAINIFPEQLKYMCIIVSEANCEGDLKREITIYYANYNVLLRQFSYCSPDVKCYMFKSYCATMYCSSGWFDSNVAWKKKLKHSHNNGLRRLLNMFKYMYE